MQVKKVINPGNEAMSARRTIRRYDKSIKISREEIKNILQDAMTAPSSLNLQPWRFVVIDSQEGKKKVEPYMTFNHDQWETSSAIIAVFGDYDNFSYTNAIYSAAVDHGLMPRETKDKMLELIAEYRKNTPDEKIKEVFLLDCGLVSMQIMLAARAYGYDTNPIGGYIKDQFTQAIGLDTKRYFPVMLITIGKAIEDGYDSIRFSVDDVTEWR